MKVDIKVNLKLSIRVFTITTAICLIFIVSYLLFISESFKNKLTKQETVDFLNFVVQVVSVGAGLSGAVFVGQTLWLNTESRILEQRSRKIEMALSYANRWNSKHLIVARKVFGLKLQEQKEEYGDNYAAIGAEFSQMMETDGEFRTSSITILDFIEELAISIEADLVDNDYAYKCFESVVKIMRKSFHSWIENEQRREDRTRVYSSFLALYMKWLEH